jgi:hypothetical protein
MLKGRHDGPEKKHYPSAVTTGNRNQANVRQERGIDAAEDDQPTSRCGDVCRDKMRQERWARACGGTVERVVVAFVGKMLEVWDGFEKVGDWRSMLRC